ncbi:MAG: hypothetical protein ABL974_16500 [Prosthecobacter sp.]
MEQGTVLSVSAPDAVASAIRSRTGRAFQMMQVFEPNPFILGKSWMRVYPAQGSKPKSSLLQKSIFKIPSVTVLFTNHSTAKIPRSSFGTELGPSIIPGIIAQERSQFTFWTPQIMLLYKRLN